MTFRDIENEDESLIQPAYVMIKRIQSTAPYINEQYNNNTNDNKVQNTITVIQH